MTWNILLFLNDLLQDFNSLMPSTFCAIIKLSILQCPSMLKRWSRAIMRIAFTVQMIYVRDIDLKSNNLSTNLWRKFNNAIKVKQARFYSAIKQNYEKRRSKNVANYGLLQLDLFCFVGNKFSKALLFFTLLINKYYCQKKNTKQKSNFSS